VLSDTSPLCGLHLEINDIGLQIDLEVSVVHSPKK